MHGAGFGDMTLTRTQPPALKLPVLQAVTQGCTSASLSLGSSGERMATSWGERCLCRSLGTKGSEDCARQRETCAKPGGKAAWVSWELSAFGGKWGDAGRGMDTGHGGCWCLETRAGWALVLCGLIKEPGSILRRRHSCRFRFFFTCNKE